MFGNFALWRPANIGRGPDGTGEKIPVNGEPRNRIGIALGLSAALLATSAFNVPFVFNPGIVILSFAFSAAVGIVFGFFPARRAAQLDPIEALRHE